jgi:hypothetical protein
MATWESDSGMSVGKLTFLYLLGGWLNLASLLWSIKTLDKVYDVLQNQIAETRPSVCGSHGPVEFPCTYLSTKAFLRHSCRAANKATPVGVMNSFQILYVSSPHPYLFIYQYPSSTSLQNLLSFPTRQGVLFARSLTSQYLSVTALVYRPCE